MSQNVRKYMVIEPIGKVTPTKAMFKMVEEALPPLRSGEALVQAEYISVDPYMWSFAGGCSPPYAQFGFQVGTVRESRSKEYPVGARVVSHEGWRDWAVVDGRPDDMFDMRPYAPELGELPASLALGALGMPGLAASLGLLEVCRPRRGDLLAVTAACGAVGSLVGQVARLHGCTVIGFTGSDEKVNILKERLNFDHAFNYKKENVAEKLREVAPKGVDCFFDNVGGTLANEIVECMGAQGRVAMCGAIGTYGRSKPLAQRSPRSVSCHLEAFSFTQWEWERQRAAWRQMREWLEAGAVVPLETVTDGFHRLPDAFIGMIKGENKGKALVKV